MVKSQRVNGRELRRAVKSSCANGMRWLLLVQVAVLHALKDPPRLIRAEVSPTGKAGALLQASVAPEVRGARHAGVAVLADLHFERRYRKQIESVRCYAQKQGYDLWLLRGTEFPACERLFAPADFFFLKHCAAAGLLEQQAPEYALAVLDADVMPVVMDRGLDAWMGGGDLQFYERIAGEEIMAGNYIAKNKPWVRKFLQNWAARRWSQPGGFSSADEGALHVALVETLEVKARQRVAELYANLTAPVADLEPYFRFVEEAKRALGPPRKWLMDRTRLGQEHNCRKCVLAIWPRMSFFVDDGVYLNRHGSRLGPVMHHGIKSPKDARRYMPGACELGRELLVESWQLGQEALQLAEGYPHLYPKGSDCQLCAGRCVANFSCRPLEL
ncbi:unnamed protein product [Effrenium voratum]|nr:unnamed protein product [Effrenium voratum]